MSASESSSASVVDQCILKLNTRLQGVIKRKRDLLLPSHFTLYQLHKVLQVSYDLCDRHLHRYNFEQDPAVFIRPRYPRREDYYDNYEEYEEDYREASRQLRAFTEEEERVRNKTITGNDERSKGVLDVIRHGYLLVYHYEGFKFTIKVEDTLPTDSYEMTQLPCCVGGACSDMTGHDGPWSEELSEKIWNREEPRFSRKKVNDRLAAAYERLHNRQPDRAAHKRSGTMELDFLDTSPL
eukprot:jgi/Chrzof1/11208/Cz05g28030.t1